MVALAEAAAERPEPVGLVLGLDPLGDHVEAQRPAEVDDRLAEHVRVADAVAARHERPVDLQLVDLEGVEVAERRVAGPEVVDREAEAERSQLADALDGLEARREQRALGDLERELRRVHAGPLERGDDHRDEARIAELARRQVDVQAEVREIEARLHGADAATALGDDPAPDRQDLAGLLGELEELAGEVQQVALGLPAEERLDADRRAVVEVDDGLEVELELVAALGAAEERGELAAGGSRVEQLLAEGDDLAATRGLGRIHGDVGVPEEVLARRAVDAARARSRCSRSRSARRRRARSAG